MAGTASHLRHRTVSLQRGLKATALLLLLLCVSGVFANQVVVPRSVNAVLGKNITLSCLVEVEANLSLTQSSWERSLPSGTITLAVFNPEFGISIASEYRERLSFRSPSPQDATVVLQDVGFADSGVYTCKAATFPLGNTQASTSVNIIVKPEVYVSAGSAPLLDGGNESVVATCTAERARPPAEVSWETELFGHSQVHQHAEPNGTTTTQVRYFWRPTRRAQDQPLTCVVRHPALPMEFRIPYQLNVQYAPEVVVARSEGEWYAGRENVQLQCRANANPPVHYWYWSRLDGPMPEGVEVLNDTLLFKRPLQQNDSGVYRCEVANDIARRSRESRIWVREPPPTTPATTTTPALVPPSSDFSNITPTKIHVQNSTTPGFVPKSSLGTIVGGVVGGVLLLVLLLILGGLCFMRQRRTFRGDYYTKQYLGPADMQKEPQLDMLQPHELQEVYGNSDPSQDSPDLKPKSCGDVILSDYNSERKDRDDWGNGMRNSCRIHREELYYPNHHSPHSIHSRETPLHLPSVNNGSPYLSEDFYDNANDSDYVSHLDGSVISRREWYV
ncbi:nectin-3-like protein isoform X1 [Arapaima gigas]